MVPFLIALALLSPYPPGSAGCPGLSAPVAGEIVRAFAPVGTFGGHWGVDFSVEPGTGVRAADAGRVTFAGEVAGVLSVTVHHGGGLRTSYSYLSEIDVTRGQWVATGSPIGRSGTDHDIAAVHFSVRVGDVYQDPANWLVCLTSPQPALTLVPLP